LKEEEDDERQIDEDMKLMTGPRVTDQSNAFQVFSPIVGVI
jgi:hypothetical protein